MITMTPTFTNAHAHIFTANHAPDYFLETAIKNDTIARLVKKFLQKDGTRWLVSGLLKFYGLFSKKNGAVIKRYLEFVKIGTSANQTKIFDRISRSYVQFPDHKIIVLTQVLDYLDLDDTRSRHIRIRSQVEDVANIKKNALYQQHIFPFLGVDPRQTGLDLLKDWAQKYIHANEGFYGIKIYPAAGFFPFDPRLDPIYEWAEKNEVPIMTHATRGGSFYLGSFQSILNSGILALNNLDPIDPLHKEILARVDALVTDPNRPKSNMVWCNIFGHPQNYEVILKKRPNLKLCLAHLGGSDEVLRGDKKNKSYPDYLQDNWYDLILGLMIRYRNVYSDISYTLADKKAMTKIKERFTGAATAGAGTANARTDMNDQFGKPLIEKLLYGTDFYLTQQEEKGDEPSLQRSFLEHFTDTAQARLIGYDNPTAYLKSVIWP